MTNKIEQGNIECEVWFSFHSTRIRMDEKCENPLVRLGSQGCRYFLGKPEIQPEIFEKDNASECRRVIESLKLPSP